MQYPEIDFETYSEAGYVLRDGKWKSILKHKSGIEAVGAPVYTEHPSARLLSLAYNLYDGYGDCLWHPPLSAPTRLFNYVNNGGILEAHNSIFEYFAWLNIAAKKYGWPSLPIEQLRCSMFKAKSWGLPGKLEKAVEVLDLSERKDPSGKALLQKLSRPNNYKRPPTSEDYSNLYKYNIQDIRAERALSAACPPISKSEEQVFLLDQTINVRGVQIDMVGLDNCIRLLKHAEHLYTTELIDLTHGAVRSVGETAKLRKWCNENGCNLHDVKEGSVNKTLEDSSIPDYTRRVLKIRSILGSNSVKKLYALERMVSSDGRMRDIFQPYGAERTGRWAGRGPQPQNMPSSGPDTIYCKKCGSYSGFTGLWCPRCGALEAKYCDRVEWCIDAAEQALQDIAGYDFQTIEKLWGNPVALISGCLRALFVAGPGKELISSDYSAIEAVILAMIADEQWRIEVFRTHGKIYETCCSKITGIPLQEILDHKKLHGQHHPLRKKFGKIPELASGYQGWIGAWIRFGADKYMSEDEMKDAILKWRADSPNIAGIKRYGEILHWGIWQGLEQAARSAIMAPGQWFHFKSISYIVNKGVLYCLLPSGRYLCYHAPQIDIDGGISYMGWNNDYLQGPVGWIRMSIYGGKFTENVVQALAADMLRYGMFNVEYTGGYPIVLHVHDEIVSEVPIGYGSIGHFESLMSMMPRWAADWPIVAKGGWRGHRFRKD